MNNTADAAALKKRQALRMMGYLPVMDSAGKPLERNIIAAQQDSEKVAAGGFGDEPMYGESVNENQVPKVVEKYKNVSSKRKVLRDLGYDVPIDNTERTELDKIAKGDVSSDYAKDLLNDFNKTVLQTQPVDIGSKGNFSEVMNKVLTEAGNKPFFDIGSKTSFVTGDGPFAGDYSLLPSANDSEKLNSTKHSVINSIKQMVSEDENKDFPLLFREAGLTYLPETGIEYNPGKNFSAEDYLTQGTLGETEAPSDASKDGFNIHYHPTDNPASKPDRHNSKLFGSTYVLNSLGNVSKYNDDISKDKNVFGVDEPNIDAVMKLAAEKKKKKTAN